MWAWAASSWEDSGRDTLGEMEAQFQSPELPMKSPSLSPELLLWGPRKEGPAWGCSRPRAQTLAECQSSRAPLGFPSAPSDSGKAAVGGPGPQPGLQAGAVGGGPTGYDGWD